MAPITASLVKTLREKTGVGMMDCKKALFETDGDIEAAIDWLRKKGLASASKKAGRTAAEGLVALKIADRRGAMIEVNTETDFVSRNEAFQNYVANVAALALKGQGDMKALTSLDYPGSGRNVGEELVDLIATIGENIQLRRVVTLSVNQGHVAGYVHACAAPDMGRIGVLVALESESEDQSVADFGRGLAMHIAACDPHSVSREELDSHIVERERALLIDQVRDSGKPEAIVAKMVEGRMRKFYEQAVLLEQAYVMDDKKSVGQILKETSDKVGAPVSVKGFVRFKIGEGIETQAENFSDEVAAMAGQG